MAKFSIMFAWTLVIVTLILQNGVQVRAQSPFPAPAMAPGPGTPASTDCLTLIYNMTDCLGYVQKGSVESKPEKACCPELAGMLDANPLCLCKFLSKSEDIPVELDMSKALKLPKVCGLETPSVSLCAVAGIPVNAPVGAPTPSQGPSSSSSGGMSPEAGEPTPGKNGASNAYFSLSYLAVGLTMALTSSLTL